MMNDTERLKLALHVRFSRAGSPVCPPTAWRVAGTRVAAATRPLAGLRYRFGYAAAFVAAIAIAGGAAGAANVIRLGYVKLITQFSVSTTTLTPGIHKADRLTIAQAQQRMPFAIVVPQALPADTRLMYAHVVSERPIARVNLSYEAHIAGEHYRISIDESTVAVGPPVVHFSFGTREGADEQVTEPLRRWKHGTVVMEMVALGLPQTLADRIVRANTR